MRTKLWTEYLTRRNHSKVQGIDESIILEWILKKECGMLWTGFIWLRIGTKKYDTQVAGSVKGGIFLE